MIIQCQGCAAKYFLPEDRVPENPTRVRCPKCTAVFTLVPHAEPVAAGRTASGPRVYDLDAPETQPVVTPPRAKKSSASATVAPEAVEPKPASPKAAAPEPVAPEAVAPEAVSAAAAPAAIPEAPATPRRRSGHSKEDRAKRLARVLVSDILIYNREKRDESLANGTLMTVLGDEIKKSWELYKEKVGSDVAGSNNYFKEALNEILADGQEVF